MKDHDEYWQPVYLRFWFVIRKPHWNKSGICSRSERFWPQYLWSCPVRCATAMVRRWMASNLSGKCSKAWENSNVNIPKRKIPWKHKMSWKIPKWKFDWGVSEVFNHVTAAWPKSQIRGIGWRDDLNVFFGDQHDTACHYTNTMRNALGIRARYSQSECWMTSGQHGPNSSGECSKFLPKVVSCNNSL